MIVPQWPAPARVRAVVTLRSTREEELRAVMPREPSWLRQVHGNAVIDLDSSSSMEREGDAAITRVPGTVCAIKAADCMPVLLADEAGTVVAGAHAGWRGLAAGVIEATIDAMGVSGKHLIAWMGPAIGPAVYEVGDEVRAAFPEKDAFSPTRPGHWLLDLYAVARHRLRGKGVERVFGGGYCTYSEPQRFYSYRRDGSTGRMAAMIWLT
ncbi:MAG TPA: peptidoglycan editing factor PgeF [Burkholderiales bacterium]